MAPTLTDRLVLLVERFGNQPFSASEVSREFGIPTTQVLSHLRKRGYVQLVSPATGTGRRYTSPVWQVTPDGAKKARRRT